jgi:hypothetical protein
MRRRAEASNSLLLEKTGPLFRDDEEPDAETMRAAADGGPPAAASYLRSSGSGPAPSVGRECGQRPLRDEL